MFSDILINTLEINLRVDKFWLTIPIMLLFLLTFSSLNYNVSKASEVVDTVTVADDPVDIFYNPSNHFIYVLSRGENMIQVINSSTYEVVKNITVKPHPFMMKAVPEIEKIFVHYNPQNTNYVEVVSTISNEVIDSIPTTSDTSTVYNPSNGYIYFGNWYSGVYHCDNSITVVNSTSNEIVHKIPIGWSARPEYNPFDNNIYVATTYNNDCTKRVPFISVINSSTNKVTNNITTGEEPRFILINPDNKNLYVTSIKSKEITIINASSKLPIKTIDLGNFHANNFNSYMIYNPLNQLMYIPNDIENNVIAINASTNEIQSKILVGKEPHQLIFNPSDGNIYVTNFLSGDVSIIDSLTNTVKDPIRTGNGPIEMAYDPLKKYLYVLNYEDNTISVIGNKSETISDNFN